MDLKTKLNLDFLNIPLKFHIEVRTDGDQIGWGEGDLVKKQTFDFKVKDFKWILFNLPRFIYEFTDSDLTLDYKNADLDPNGYYDFYFIDKKNKHLVQAWIKVEAPYGINLLEELIKQNE